MKDYRKLCIYILPTVYVCDAWAYQDDFLLSIISYSWLIYSLTLSLSLSLCSCFSSVPFHDFSGVWFSLVHHSPCCGLATWTMLSCSPAWQQHVDCEHQVRDTPCARHNYENKLTQASCKEALNNEAANLGSNLAMPVRTQVAFVDTSIALTLRSI